jgi:hypothetical protein
MAYKLFWVIEIWVSEEERALVLFCFVVVVVVSRVFKVPSGGLQRVSKSQLQRDSSLVGGLAKAVAGCFYHANHPSS